jgi:hypothetical protein
VLQPEDRQPPGSGGPLVAGESRGGGVEAPPRRGVWLTVEFDSGDLLSALGGFDGDVGVGAQVVIPARIVRPAR